MRAPRRVMVHAQAAWSTHYVLTSHRISKPKRRFDFANKKQNPHRVTYSIQSMTTNQPSIRISIHNKSDVDLKNHEMYISATPTLSSVTSISIQYGRCRARGGYCWSCSSAGRLLKFHIGRGYDHAETWTGVSPVSPAVKSPMSASKKYFFDIVSTSWTCIFEAWRRKVCVSWFNRWYLWWRSV